MTRNTKEFKALKAKWDKKLVDSGFEDIEQEDGNLKFWAAHSYIKRHDQIKIEAKEEYYRLAGHFLFDYKFETLKEKEIWQLHSEGVPFRDISIILNKKNVKTNKDSVNKVVAQLMAKMLELYQNGND